MSRSPRLHYLIDGNVRRMRIGQPGDNPTADAPKVLFPGAFNPLHQGHRDIVRVAESRLGADTHFELSVLNVDKPPLAESEIEHRISQFSEHDLVWLTRAPTFLEKARLFPGAIFLIGADTITRIADPSYYGDSRSAVRRAVCEIRDQGCKFLVFGRIVEDSFRVLSELQIEDELLSISTEVAESEFRSDVSSTELRERL